MVLDWEGGHKGNCKKDADQRKVGYTNIELRDMMGRIIKGGSSGSAGSTRWLCLATSCNSLCAIYGQIYILVSIGLLCLVFKVQ